VLGQACLVGKVRARFWQTLFDDREGTKSAAARTPAMISIHDETALQHPDFTGKVTRQPSIRLRLALIQPAPCSSFPTPYAGYEKFNCRLVAPTERKPRISKGLRDPLETAS
jgi:hypothetical protein